MQVSLTVTNNASKEVSEASFGVQDRITIGRHLDSPVLVQGNGLSRNHFALALIGGELTVEDLSSNGTWLNGVLLKARMNARLKSGDVIEIPGYRMEVSVQEATAEPLSSAVALPPAAISGQASTWARPLAVVLNFIEPLGLALMVLAVLSFALVGYCLNR